MSACCVVAWSSGIGSACRSEADVYKPNLEAFRAAVAARLALLYTDAQLGERLALQQLG